MTESFESGRNTEEESILEDIRGELNALGLDVKKESFKAEQKLKDEVKRLGFYNGDENGENVRFNIGKVKEYLESIKNKTWSELDVKSSELEKGVRTIAIQIAINYINMKNGESTSEINWIDGIRGSNTWKGVKRFQVKYNLKNKDGLPGHETITKIIDLLGGNTGGVIQPNEQGSGLGNSHAVTHGAEQPINLRNIQLNSHGTQQRTNLGNDKLNNLGIGQPINLGGGQLNHPGVEQPVVLGAQQLNSRGFTALERTKSIEEFIKNRGIQSNIDDDKCFNLILKNFKIKDKYNNGNFLLRPNTTGNTDTDLDTFKGKLTIKVEGKGGLEGVIFKNPEVQSFLTSIVDRQGQEIKNIKLKYEQKNISKDTSKIGKGMENNESIEPVQSWEDYKAENFSQKSFEEFVLSDEGIAIIKEEIKSHIDTNYQDESGEYNKFHEKYPISAANLEIKLRSAWENKMQWEYNIKNGIYDEEKKEEMEKLDVISNRITGDIDKIIGEYIKSGKENFDQDIIGSLELLLSEGTHGVPISEIFSDQNHKDTFKVVLTDKIKKYGMFVHNKGDIKLDTGDKQIDLQLKAYLYIYGSIFYSEFGYFESNKNTSYYEEILPDIMRIIMSGDDTSFINKIKHKELLEAEKKLEEERKLRDLERRREAAKRNISKNGALGRVRSIDIADKLIDNNANNLDIDNATGAQIAAKENLGKKLSEYDVNIGNSEMENEAVKCIAFRKAWENFINSYGELKKIMNINDMRKLYNIDNRSINEDEWKNFKETNLFIKGSPDDAKKLYNILSNFSMEYENTINDMRNNMSNGKDIIKSSLRESAIGCVIDNIKGVLSSKGFKFDSNEPVKKQGDSIIISGKIDGTDSEKGTNIKVRYDLKTGQLFMNSFVKYTENHSKVTIGNDSEINEYIGKLVTFDEILESHYSLEGGDKSGLSNSNKIDNISDKINSLMEQKVSLMSNTIIEDSKKQSSKISTITKFMKTFNIIVDGGENKNIEFHDGSNLFDFIQLVENSDSNTLDKFQLFMEKIINPEISGLEWGNNNISGAKETQSSKIFFEENSDNKNISLLKDCINDFSTNLTYLKDKVNFDRNSNLGFAQMIKENLTDDVSKPNRKLDESKMRKFFKNAGLDSPF